MKPSLQRSVVKMVFFILNDINLIFYINFNIKYNQSFY